MSQAEWNDIKWGALTRQLAAITDFTISQSLKIEEQNTDSGQNKMTIKGLEPEQLVINYKAGFSVGLDPRGEFDMLKKCMGMQDDFLIAGSPISNSQFELDEIELSNTILSDSGRILSGDLTLRFNTESDSSSKGGKGKKKKKGKTKKKKKGSLTLKPEDIAKAKSMANS